MVAVNWTNVTVASDLLKQPNVATGGNFWLGMLMMIFGILVIIFSAFGIEVALLGSGFICLVLSIFLVYMNLLAWQWVLFFMALLIMIFLYSMYSRDRDF